jgi:DNA-binding winged helix-turn-helix (wHTH) protein
VEKAIQNAQIIRFATFEVDLRSGELRKSGVRLKLSDQPFHVLAILLEQPGQVVTREELQKRLWPDTFVDVDHNLNTAINKIREALNDSADTPRFVETLPRRGYRFIATLDNANPSPKPLQTSIPTPPLKTNARVPARRVWVFVGALAAIIAVGLFFFRRHPSSSGHHPRTLTRVTFEDGLQIGATWSPDGRYIAYASDHLGKFDIWVKQLSGGDPVKVTRSAGQNWQPDWSPDGKHIAYRSENADGGLFVIPAWGGSGMERKVSSFGYYPRWAPDGSKLLFQTGRYGLGSKIFVVDLGESDPPREVLADVTSREFVISAAWHPDSKRISVWNLTVLPSRIPSFWTASVDSPKSPAPAIKTEISPGVLSIARGMAGGGIGEFADADSDFKLCWAPSGKHIYFERTFRGARNIWRMSMDPLTLRATAIERLTTGTELEAEPSLSSDGSKLAFTTQPEQVRAWVFPFNADLGRVTGVGQPASSLAVEAWG